MRRRYLCKGRQGQICEFNAGKYRCDRFVKTGEEERRGARGKGSGNQQPKLTSIHKTLLQRPLHIPRRIRIKRRRRLILDPHPHLRTSPDQLLDKVIPTRRRTIPLLQEAYDPPSLQHRPLCKVLVAIIPRSFPRKLRLVVSKHQLRRGHDPRGDHRQIIVDMDVELLEVLVILVVEKRQRL